MNPVTQTAVISRLGIIGGSGVYDIEGVDVVKDHSVKTPFGSPSDAVVEMRIKGSDRTFFFIPRHGKGHRLTPSEVPYQANIHALKQLGVTHLMAVSAVGIMKENIKPGEMVVPDQLFDRTKGNRPSTFFGDGLVGHVSFADPFCKAMTGIVASASEAAGAKTHRGGTYVGMEGPQFSTRAESHFYRATLNPSVIGMTALPEAKLAREAEMCYGMLALATDYDCWNEKEGDVNVEAVLAVLKSNAALANKIVKGVSEKIPNACSCGCHSAAAMAIISQTTAISDAAREKFTTLYGKYLKR